VPFMFKMFTLYVHIYKTEVDIMLFIILLRRARVFFKENGCYFYELKTLKMFLAWYAETLNRK
jgi:hypothetical protein